MWVVSWECGLFLGNVDLEIKEKTNNYVYKKKLFILFICVEFLYMFFMIMTVTVSDEFLIHLYITLSWAF